MVENQVLIRDLNGLRREKRSLETRVFELRGEVTALQVALRRAGGGDAASLGLSGTAGDRGFDGGSGDDGDGDGAVSGGGRAISAVREAFGPDSVIADEPGGGGFDGSGDSSGDSRGRQVCARRLLIPHTHTRARARTHTHTNTHTHTHTHTPHAPF